MRVNPMVSIPAVIWRVPSTVPEVTTNRPRGHHFYEGTDSMCELAALYAVALVKAHTFRDGNKRTALLSIRAFLKANDLEFDYGPYDEEAAEMMTGIATGSVDQEDVTEWIRHNTVGAS
jgi:death-on-curing protein